MRLAVAILGFESVEGTCSARATAMKVEGNASPRRWAPEWIAVLTLAVAIVGLGGGMFTSLNAMEARLRADMRAMENRLREDMREVRADLGNLRERLTRLETRFDEEFPRGAHSAL